MAEFTEMIDRDYDITKKPITVRNPEANTIVEQVHQTMGNMIRMFDIPNMENPEEQVPGMLAAIASGICSTIHTTTRATPMQLVFGRDAILNVKHLADWRYIKSRKQIIINKNNIKENNKRKEDNYTVSKQVLIKQDWTSKYGTIAYKGPYPVCQVNDNGMVKVQTGHILDTYNICQLRPYKQ